MKLFLFKPLTVKQVTMPRKSSQCSSKRTISSRTQETKEFIKIISGDTGEALKFQSASFIKSLGKEERAEIMKSLSVTIPKNHMAAMKATLNMQWNQIRELRRWLKSFNVELASESKTRATVNERVGKGLITEMAPLTAPSQSGRYLQINPTPWAYVYNLVGHVLKHLKHLHDHDKLVVHPFIPEDEIIVKIGGDHGGDSFKMCYQVANVENPNNKHNTIVFSLFEAKDTRPNLRICLQRFRSHIQMLGKQTFLGKRIKVVMFGDYEFLCAMYGLWSKW